MSNDKTVEELLIQHEVPYRISGKDFVTSCFNPEHDDSNPSFRIDRFTGISHCFSCGWKLNIFKHYGVNSENASVRVAKLKEKLRLLAQTTNGLDMLEGAKPFNKVYRDISSQTYKEFDAFTTTKVSGMEDRVIFPIKDVRGKITSFVGRDTLGRGGANRYKIHPPGATNTLFPTKLPSKFYSIILVEGLFDFLNLWDKGAKNVVCTFGVDGLKSNVSEKLMPFKVAGISKVFILYDGDDAGREAADIIKPLIEEAGFQVEIIPVPEDSDPGEMTQEDVNQIVEYTK